MSPGGGPAGPAAAARRVLVRGRVQGVAFRWSAMAEGNRLGLAGWARNLPDGRVEVHAQGDPEALAALVAWLHAGPPGAEVAAVSEESAVPEPGLEAFEIRR
ncbi:MAG: acylphosphatase [Actinomycetota bacterium]